MIEPKLCDSDTENRMRHDLYLLRAASMYHAAYYNLLSSEENRLVELIGKGIGPPLVKQYMEAWQRCESDATKLRLRTEKAEKAMQVARREMEQYSAKQTKITLQFKLQELENKLWGGHSSLSQGGSVVFISRL